MYYGNKILAPAAEGNSCYNIKTHNQEYKFEPKQEYKQEPKQEPKQEYRHETKQEKQNKNPSTGHYQAKYLLTRNEWHEYKKLRDLASAHGLQICPKVRLLDIVEPRRGDPNYMSYMGKIKSKHVDFVICDQDLRIKGIVELDDNSHDRPDRSERDSFVDEVLTSVGYTVIRARSVTKTTLDPITAPKTTAQ